MSIISILELAGVAHLPRSQQLIESVILVEGYKEAQVEFGSVAGEEQAKATIDKFRDLVNRNQVQGNERNIDYWRKQGWDKFSTFIELKSQEKSKREEAKDQGRSVTIHEDANWLIVVPIDKSASCFHGRNTDWCTTKPNARYFEDYVYRNNITLIYFLKLDTGDKWAIACYPRDNKIELFDRHDNKISEQQFKQQTGFDPVEYRNRVMQSRDVRKLSTDARSEYIQAEDRIWNAFDRGLDERDPQIERDLLLVRDPRLIVSYCKRIGDRWSKGEPIIAKDTEQAVDYAVNFLGQRWPEGEKEIMTSSRYLIDYMQAFDIERWPEAERYMINKQRALAAMYYAREVLNKRWPEAERVALLAGEDLIKQIEREQDPHTLKTLDIRFETLRNAMDLYADEFLDGNWPEAKPIYDYVLSL